MCNFYDLITLRLQTCFFELPSGAWEDFRPDLVWVPQGKSNHTEMNWLPQGHIVIVKDKSTYVWS